MLFSINSVAGIQPHGGKAEYRIPGTEQQPEVKQGLGWYIGCGADLGTTRPADQVETDPCGQAAQSGRRLACKGNRGKEDAFLAPTVFELMVVHDVGD